MMTLLFNWESPPELIKIEFSNDKRMTMAPLVLIAILDIMSQTGKELKTAIQTRYKT